MELAVDFAWWLQKMVYGARLSCLALLRDRCEAKFTHEPLDFVFSLYPPI